MEYQCTCCNYKTTIKCCIVKHYLTKKHFANFKKSKYCDICKKDYNNNSNFRRHYLTHHQDDIANCGHISNNHKNNNQIDIHKNNNNLIKQVIDAKEDIKNEINKTINKSNKELLEANKEIIDQSNKQVVAVVNKAITKASALINYLMIHHSSTPPLKKITQTKCIKMLKLNYNCTGNNNLDLEKKLLSDYVNKMFVKSISKSILSIVNHKKPELQPIWNTDCARNHYVIKTSDNWNEDKAGIKFTDYIIKPLLTYIKDLMTKYEEVQIKTDMRPMAKNPTEVLEHMTKLRNCLLFESDLLHDVFVQPILKELSPYLRYLSSELNLDDEDDDDEDDDDDQEKIEDLEKLKKLEELKLIQDDLINIVKNTKSDNSDESYPDDSDNSDAESVSSASSEKSVHIYKTKTGKVIKL